MQIAKQTLLAAIIAAAAVSAQANETITTPSGVDLLISYKGTGPATRAGAVLVLNYTGSLSNGIVFDKSADHGGPFTVELGAHQVIPGMDEALIALHVGDKARITIPPQLGYGEKGAGDVIPPNATLVFDVDILEMHDTSWSAQLRKVLTGGSNEKKDRALYIDAMLKTFDQMLKEGHAGLYVDESGLIGLGYHVAKKDGAKALAYFAQAQNLLPKSSGLHEAMAENYAGRGDKAMAIAEYRKALALDPKDADAAKELDKLLSETADKKS